MKKLDVTNFWIFMFREGVVLATSPHRLKHIKWDKVFKNGPNKICGRQPLKNLK